MDTLTFQVPEKVTPAVELTMATASILPNGHVSLELSDHTWAEFDLSDSDLSTIIGILANGSASKPELGSVKVVSSDPQPDPAQPAEQPIGTS